MRPARGEQGPGYAFAVDDSGRYLIVRVYGDVTRGFARAFCLAASERGAQAGLRRYLFDLRGSRNLESTFSNYVYAYEDMNALGLERNARVALLVDVDDASHDFVETVMRNAGYNLCLFRDEAAARAWLQGEGPG